MSDLTIIQKARINSVIREQSTWLLEQLERGTTVQYNAPIGVGRLQIVALTCMTIGRTLFIGRPVEVEQFWQECTYTGYSNFETRKAFAASKGIDDAGMFDCVVLSEGLQDVQRKRLIHELECLPIYIIAL